MTVPPQVYEVMTVPPRVYEVVTAPSRVYEVGTAPPRVYEVVTVPPRVYEVMTVPPRMYQVVTVPPRVYEVVTVPPRVCEVVTVPPCMYQVVTIPPRLISSEQREALPLLAANIRDVSSKLLRASRSAPNSRASKTASILLSIRRHSLCRQVSPCQNLLKKNSDFVNSSTQVHEHTSLQTPSFRF